MTEEELFESALKLPAEAAAALLDRACANDLQLRRRVEALLAAHVQSNPLDRPLAATGLHATGDGDRNETTTFYPRSDVASAQIGPYVLERMLGEGGMGTVWVARQIEPVRRRVALKLIKAGRDSREVLARFEHERQALALMDHPNIARVLDAGLTPDGRPYFAMELIDGLPLTRYCDEATLSTEERLEVFIQVCSAVQHAHQKGIIHRDLKPANILVTTIDGRPVPKAIDFGVSKALGDGAADRSPTTQFGAVVGTFEYMAPEQAGYSGTDIDTRADIYALGVILYELLTGLRPFDATRLRRAALDEILRIIREEEPSKPSTRLSSSEATPSLAAARQSDPARLARKLRGDLDWIALKCLEKDRSRRYESASQLAAEIRRYLEDEPVTAGPPSSLYRFRKFVRRNRGQVAAATAILAALVGGLAVSLWQTNRAFHAEGRASSARDSERGQRLRADEQRAKAEENAALAAEGNAQAREALDVVTDDVVQGLVTRGQLTDEERAFLKRILGFYDRFTKLEGDSPEALKLKAEGYRKIAWLQASFGAREDAVEAYRNMHDVYERLAVDQPGEFSHRLNAADALRRMSEQIFLVGSFDESGRLLDEAQSRIDAALAEHPDDLFARHLSALCLIDRGHRLERGKHNADSAGAYRQALERLKGLLRDRPGDIDFTILATDCVNHVVWEMHEREGRAPEAEAMLIEALARLDDPRLVASIDAYWLDQVESRYALTALHLGLMLSLRGEHVRAVEAFDRAVAKSTTWLKRHPSHPGQRWELARTQQARGASLAKLDRHADAVVALREAEEALALLDDDSDADRHVAARADLLQQQAASLAKLGRTDEAVAAYRRSAKFIQANLDASPDRLGQLRRVALVHDRIGGLFAAKNQTDQASDEYREAAALHEAAGFEFRDLPDVQASAARSRARAAQELAKGGDVAGALEEVERAATIFRSVIEATAPSPQYRVELGYLYQNAGDQVRDAGRHDLSAALRRKAIDVWEPLLVDFPGTQIYRDALGWSRRALGAATLAIVFASTDQQTFPNALSFRDGVAEFEAALAAVGERPNEPAERVEFRRACVDELANAATIRRTQGRLEEALPVFRRVVEHREKLVEDYPDRPQFLFDAARSRLDVGRTLLELRSVDDAVAEIRQAEALNDRLAEAFPKETDLRSSLAIETLRSGRALRDAGHAKQSAEIYGMALRMRAALDEDFPNDAKHVHSLAWARIHYGVAQLVLEEHEAAVDSMRRAYDDFSRRTALGPDVSTSREDFDEAVAEICESFEQYDRPEAVAETALRYRDDAKRDDRDLVSLDATILSRGGMALSTLKRFDEAELLFRDSLKVREAVAPNDWETFDAQSRLGEALLDQGKLESALEPLTRSHEGLVARRPFIPGESRPRIREAIARLKRLADERQSPMESAGWQAELDAFDADPSGTATPVASTASPGDEP